MYQNKSGPLCQPIKLSFSRSLATPLFESANYPWEALYSLGAFIRECGSRLPYDQYDEISQDVWVHISAYLAPNAKIHPPAIICGGVRLSNFTVVSGSIIGAFADLGEFSRVNTSILFDQARLCGHNCVNCSILGYHSKLGIGAMLPECRQDGEKVAFKLPEGLFVTNKTRLGSIICDGAIIGENSVVSAGGVVGEGVIIPPLSSINEYTAEGFARRYI